jgi:hypothetical protein
MQVSTGAPVAELPECKSSSRSTVTAERGNDRWFAAFRPVSGVVVNKSERYRHYAQECLEIASSTDDASVQAIFIQMAQVWFRLAQAGENVPEPTGED